jgi:hypothetical protein
VFADLVMFLERMFIATANPVANRALRCFIAESQHDETFRPKFYELFLAGRRKTLSEVLDHGKAIGQIRRDIENEIVADLLYGAFSARLITGHAPLDRVFAERLIATLRPALEVPR